MAQHADRSALYYPASVINVPRHTAGFLGRHRGVCAADTSVRVGDVGGAAFSASHGLSSVQQEDVGTQIAHTSRGAR